MLLSECVVVVVAVGVGVSFEFFLLWLLTKLSHSKTPLRHIVKVF